MPGNSTRKDVDRGLYVLSYGEGTFPWVRNSMEFYRTVQQYCQWLLIRHGLKVAFNCSLSNCRIKCMKNATFKSIQFDILLKI